MIIINESPNSLRLLKNKIFYDEKELSFFSTIGFINNYNLIDNKVTINPINKDIFNKIKSLKNKKIVIATDIDDAGNFIALEIINILDKSNDIYRFNNNFEILFDFKELNENNILDKCIKKINIDSAIRYWQKMNTKELRLNIINYLLDKETEITLEEGIK